MKHEYNLGAAVPVIKIVQPVFVVGMNGSGTTMLVDSLGRHPDLYGYPHETKLIPPLIASLDSFGDLISDENFLRLWIDVCTRLNHRHPVPVPENWRDFDRNLAAVLDAAFRYFAAWEGKTRWCEKTPQHIQHLPGLHSLFPEAKFIHVIRDGRDSAASFNRRFKRAPEYSIYRWKHVVREGRKQGELLGDRYMEIRYENVTADPELWMRRITDFLELPFHPDVLLSRQPQTGHSGTLGEVKGGLVPNSGKWRTAFSARKQIQLEKIGGACLAELDYPVQYCTGDVEPSRIKLLYWQWKDNAWELLNLFRREWGRQRKIRWSEIMRRVRIALGQSRANRF